MRFVALREMTFALPSGGEEVLAKGESVEVAHEADLEWWEHSSKNLHHATGGWERFQIRAAAEGKTPILYFWRGRIRFGIAGVDVGFIADPAPAAPPSSGVTMRRRSA